VDREPEPDDYDLAEGPLVKLSPTRQMREEMDVDVQYASFDDLVSGSLEDGAEDLILPSGKVVRLRGLSRHELMFNGKGAENDNALIERRNVVSCLLQPKLTLPQVEKWQRNSAAGGDFKVLSERIRDLSGLGEGADKSDPGASGDD
jgi:hypothetical protein